MVEYLKSVKSKKEDQGDYYHWNTNCPDYPNKSNEAVLIFKTRPQHIIPCTKCNELDKKEKSNNTRDRQNRNS
jgi:hypothetical protein